MNPQNLNKNRLEIKMIHKIKIGNVEINNNVFLAPMAGITDISYEEILQNVIFRDNNDKTSSVAPLKQAEDAVLIDSSHMTIEEVTEAIIHLYKDVR